MTFDYANGYDGKTIHYKVKALTGANLPLYITISVVDTTNNCRTTSLTYNDENPLAYKAPVYIED
jgi:hypothetical protein